MNTTTLIIGFASIQGLFLSIVIATLRRGNQRANMILSVLIGLFSLRLMEFFVLNAGWLQEYPHFSLVTVPFNFLLGPLLYFYAQALLKPDMVISKFQMLHLLPFIADIALMIPYYFTSGETKLLWINLYLSGTRVIDNFWLMIMTFQMLHLLIYIFFTYRFLTSEEGNIHHTRWLRKLVFFFIVLCVLNIILLNVNFVVELNVQWLEKISLIMRAVFISSIGFWALRNPQIFELLENKKQIRYEKSGLTKELSDLYLNRIKGSMEQKKLYRDSALTLQSLSEITGVSVHHASQVINEQLGQNFFEFVNGYRIEEAKRLLADNQRSNETVLSIAFEVGFNTKASFNSIFKKYTSKTPSEYRSEVKTDKI